MSIEDEVREASRQFYAALNKMANGVEGAMESIWSHGGSVTSMHPIGGRQVGWDAVKTSFDQVAQIASNAKIVLKDQLIQTGGDMACEIGVESGRFKLANKDVAIDQRVTNVYRKEAGGWKVIHHHTDTSSAMVEVLSNLQAQSGKAGR